MKLWRPCAVGSLIIGAILAAETGGLSEGRGSERTPQKEKPGVSQRAKPADEQTPDPQKERAVQLLREALDSSSTIENVGERSLLVCFPARIPTSRSVEKTS